MNTRCHPERSARLTRFFCGSGGRGVEEPLYLQEITGSPPGTTTTPGLLALRRLREVTNPYSPRLTTDFAAGMIEMVTV